MGKRTRVVPQAGEEEGKVIAIWAKNQIENIKPENDRLMEKKTDRYGQTTDGYQMDMETCVWDICLCRPSANI